MSTDKEIGIVVIAYNRVKSLSRLLHSLRTAEYFNDKVDLVISIDYSGEDAVYKLARNFEWPFGEKKVIQHPKNLGLRSHVLFCGSFTKEYKSICVFEDDIFVSPGFYNFAKQVIPFYKNNDSVAGISLYAHKWNQFVNRPFAAIHDEYDIYFLQQAKSWGQIWIREQWNDFIAWYELNKTKDLTALDFPDQIAAWPDSSWLKYHMKYLVEKNKYFVYPKQSLSTNFNDVGTHAIMESNSYQVPLQMGATKIYNFSKTIGIYNTYDIFFENKMLHKYLDVDEHELTVDLYGNKRYFKKYLLTTKPLDFEVIKTFGLRLRPHELNVILNVSGEDIFLYNTSEVRKSPKSKYSEINRFMYDVKTTSKKQMFLSSLFLYYQALKMKVKRIVNIRVKKRDKYNSGF